MSSPGLRGWFRSAFFDNLSLKLVALVFAVGFYTFIHGAERAQRTFAVSVVSVMPPEGANRQLLTTLPREIAVTLRGSRVQLDGLKAEDLGSVTLDLTHAQDMVLRLDPSMLSVPAGLEIEQMFPPRIEVRWDDVVARSIPVQIARAGEPAEGFEVEEISDIDPELVQARGPRTVVDAIQYARAEPFDVTNLRAGVHRRSLTLIPPPPPASFDVQNVSATVVVTAKLETIEFQKVSVEVVGMPTARTVPTTVNVVVRGPPESIDRLTQEAVVPRVEVPADVDRTQAGSAYLNVIADAPGAATVELQPSKVLVKWDGLKK